MDQYHGNGIGSTALAQRDPDLMRITSQIEGAIMRLESVAAQIHGYNIRLYGDRPVNDENACQAFPRRDGAIGALEDACDSLDRLITRCSDEAAQAIRIA